MIRFLITSKGLAKSKKKPVLVAGFLDLNFIPELQEEAMNSKSTRRVTLLCTAILAVAVFSGCGAPPGPAGSAPDTRPVSKVTGQFTAKGANINGAGLAAGFQPAEGGIYRSINLNADGSFSGDAIVGMNKIFLIPVGTTSVGHDDTSSGIDSGYLSPSGSPLTADVKASGENKFAFDVSVPIPASEATP
jgi:hypothetical protein